MSPLRKGLLKKSRLLRRYAPRNDKKDVFQVIASDSKNRVAISKRCNWTFSTDLKAGGQSEKLDSRSFDSAQDRFRGNDKYFIRNRN